MIKKTIFREYDIRGKVPEDLNEKSVKLIGYFLGKEIQNKTKIGAKVSVGYDARTHSPTLFKYLVSGLNKSGCEVYDIGMVATGISYYSSFVSIDGVEVDASVMITGSHNPKEYNGFKITVDKKPFFGEDIYRLGEIIINNQDLEIEDNYSAKKLKAKESYINFMVKEFESLKGLDKKIVFDCGNGVANTVLGEILNRLEIKYKGLFCEPNGEFPNHHPDPSEEKNLADIKNELNSWADFGFAYDGDADRIAFLTKKYNYKGDILAIFFAKFIESPTVIGEVKCSGIMYKEIENNGGKAIMYKTGHSNLKVKMAEVGADLACEVSGHIFFNDRYFGYDDAIYATFRILEMIKNGFDFEAEFEALPKVYSTEEIKIKTTDEEKFKIIERLKEVLKKDNSLGYKKLIEVDGIRIEFDDGFALVRASNTTPVLVTRFEALSEQKAKFYQEKVMQIVQNIKIV